MNVMLYIIPGILLNTLIGAVVMTSLDTKDQIFYKWYKTDPTQGILSFFVLTFWPVMSFGMIKYKMESEKFKLKVISKKPKVKM